MNIGDLANIAGVTAFFLSLILAIKELKLSHTRIRINDAHVIIHDADRAENFFEAYFSNSSVLPLSITAITISLRSKERAILEDTRLYYEGPLFDIFTTYPVMLQPFETKKIILHFESKIMSHEISQHSKQPLFPQLHVKSNTIKFRLQMITSRGKLHFPLRMFHIDFHDWEAALYRELNLFL